MIFRSQTSPPSPPQTSQTILKRCWNNMVTGSNLARSLGNLYSADQNPIKIPSCFQAHMKLSFPSPPPWASSFDGSCSCLGPKARQEARFTCREQKAGFNSFSCRIAKAKPNLRKHGESSAKAKLTDAKAKTCCNH